MTPDTDESVASETDDAETRSSTTSESAAAETDGSGARSPDASESVTAEADGSTTLSPDDVFEILSNHRRRMVLYYLRHHGNSSTVNELADEIAAMENELSVDEITSQQRKRVYVSLYQTHLPKMDDHDVLEYDQDEGAVSLGPQSATIDRYLGGGAVSSNPWTLRHFAIVLFGGTILVFSLFGVPGFDAIPSNWAGLGLLFLYVTSAGSGYFFQKRRTNEIPLETDYSNT